MANPGHRLVKQTRWMSGRIDHHGNPTAAEVNKTITTQSEMKEVHSASVVSDTHKCTLKRHAEHQGGGRENDVVIQRQDLSKTLMLEIFHMYKFPFWYSCELGSKKTLTSLNSLNGDIYGLSLASVPGRPQISVSKEDSNTRASPGEERGGTFDYFVL